VTKFFEHAVHFHAHIAVRNAQYVGYFFLGPAFQPKPNQGFLYIRELGNGLVQRRQVVGIWSRVGWGRYLQGGSV